MKIKLVLLVALGGLFFVSQVFAYSPFYTHPDLTQEMAELFNLKSTNSGLKITRLEIVWLKQGAINEDDAPRWINHFYDPVHKTGWSGKHFGYLTQEEGQKTGADFSPKLPMASIDWVVSQESQALYGDTQGNQTWQKAVKSYIDGDKMAAFIALGHILHLVEDASVPEHTRDDTHSDLFGDVSSPYESYSKDFTNFHTLTLAQNLKNESLPDFSTIQQAIQSMAVYSNSNFFSEDTIGNNEFSKPDMLGLEMKDGYLYSSDTGIYLATYKQQGSTIIYSVDDSKTVMPSYREHLFPKVVLTGASVINLFFKDVEYYKLHPDQLEPIVPDSSEPLVAAISHAPKKMAVKIFDTASRTSVEVAKTIFETKTAVNWLLNSVGIQVASNNQAASQSNSELSDQTPSPAEPVSLPVTIVPAQSAKPLTPGGIIAAQPQTTAQTPTPSLLTPPEIILPNPTPAPTIVAPIPVVQQMVYGGGPAGSPAPTLLEPVVVPAQEIFLLPEVVVDIIPPPVPVVTVANQTGVTSTNILVSLQSVDELSPPTYFDLEFSTNTTDWVSLVTSTINTDFNFTGTRGEKYYFKSRATDSLSNVSDWSSASSPVFVNWSGEVVMNEVAWAGTSATFSSDEWFELYNNSNQDINLSGWKILVGGKTLDWSKVNTTTIPSHTFYLFERTNDNTIKEIGADAIYTLSGGFNNSGEKLELIKPNGEKADEVDASGGWFAGDSVLYKSMERLDPDKNGSNPANWQSNQGFRLSGRSFNGGQIYGSPKRSNFGSINLNLDQDEAVRVLVKSGSPYILQYYKVPAGKTLNIEPGVVIKSYFNNSKIDVYGALNAVGLGNKKIIFTSGRDADFAEDINKTIIGSWSGANPLAQDWQGIWFHSGATGALDNIVLRYAGHDFKAPPSPISTNQAVRIEGASIEISNSIFSDNGLLTLYIKDSSSTISNAIFSRGEQAVKSENSSLAISNSSFENFQNNHGPYTYISGPVHVIGRWPHLENLTFTNNDLNMPFLDRVAINESQASIAEFSNILVNSLTVSASSTLDIARGVGVFMPAQTEIVINGSLRAIGTADKPISFSSYPSSTYWKNLKFNNSVSVLDFVNLKRGGNSGCMACGAILANSSDLTINHSNIWDSDTFNAVRATNSTISISNTEIDGFVKRSNNQYGINARGGILRLDNVMLKNLNVGIEAGSPADSLPVLEKKNMSTSSFTNVDYLVEPPTWWDGVVSTTP